MTTICDAFNAFISALVVDDHQTHIKPTKYVKCNCRSNDATSHCIAQHALSLFGHV